MDMSLFYSKKLKKQLLGYADPWYLLDPHKAGPNRLIVDVYAKIDD